MDKKIFTVSENGFSMDGSGKVSIPACRIKAVSFTDAKEKLSKFLATKKTDSDIELITPIDHINFD